MAYYSHSKIQSYRSCPRMFKLRYIDRITDDEEGIEAFMGSRVHEVLERLYRGVGKSKHLELEDALAHYDLSWDQNWHEQVKVVNPEFSVENYRETGRSCIRRYWESYAPFDQGIAVGIERKVKVALDEERGIVLQGYVDRIDRVGDGVYEIHDYKTSANLPEQAIVDADPQLALYQLAIEDMWPDDVRDVTLVWHYVAHGVELRSKRDREALDRLKAETLAAIEKIESDTQFAPSETALCDWCGYQALCPRKKHLVTVSELPPKEFHADDGVKLVDRYVELTERKAESVAELDSQIEAVKEELIAFAGSEGLEVVVGSDHKVTVKLVKGLSVPRKGTEERDRLEETVRSLGKWEEASCLDTGALARAIRDEDWEAETCSALSAFLTACEDYRVTKSRLRTGRASD